MPTLSSILVQRGAASMRTVEDAIARQVFHGGDLATNLLELGGVREEVLIQLVAEAAGLPPAPAGRLVGPSADVLRLVPGELALRHGIFPLELQERALVVAVAEPLPAAVEDDLGFALDVAIRQVIAPLVRIRHAIATTYGIPLDRRFARLQAKLEGSADPSPSAIPPPGHDLLPGRMPRPVSIPVPTFGTGVPGSERAPARLETKPAPKAPFVAQTQDFVNPAIPRSPSLPAISMDVAELPPAEPAPELEVPSHAISAPTIVSPPERQITRTLPRLPASAHEEDPAPAALALTVPVLPRPAAAPLPFPIADTLPGPPPAERLALEPTRPGVATRALAGVLRDALRDERTVDKRAGDARPRWRAAERRRKGPLTTARAELELEESTTTEEVFEILFAFAHQFFEYAALFVVHGELAEGRDAAGPGADRAKISGIGVPLDLPSSLATARARKSPVITAPATDGLDADLIRDLGRSGREKPRVSAFLPVAIRNRVVALIYGDDGSTDVELAAIGDVIAVIGLAASALERIALRKKLGSRAPAMPVRVRIQDGAAALARAISSSAAVVAARPQTPASPTATDAVDPPRAPRTTRYFDEPDAAIRFAEDDQRTEDRAPQEPLARRDSWMPVVSIEAEPPRTDSHRAPTPSPTRRGVAPHYEGRTSAPPEEAQIAWVSGPAVEPPPAPSENVRRDSKRTLRSIGLAPLPLSPPPNAVTSFPSNPPPASHRELRPLPREEDAEPVARRPSSRPPARLSSAPPGSRAREPLPSVMVDVGAEHRELIQRVIDGGHRGQEAFDALVKAGDQVMQAVMARFPGPLRVDRHRARGELPAASQCGPVLELVVAIRRPALPFVSVRSSAQDPEVRFWATHTLGELRYPEAASVLVPRLFDDDAQVRRIARRSAAALVAAGAAGGPILKGLEDITRNPDQPKPNRLVAIETMGEIRSGSLVPALLDALEDASEDISGGARRALLLITRQDFGHEVRGWTEWWANNAGRHRIEWLIDALMHDQPSVRRAAGDELKLLTKEYFGYYDDLPRRDRERAQGLYRSWWDREGRRRFS